MVETDEKGGHDNGWMTDAYLKRISIAIDNVRRVVEACGDEYTVIVIEASLETDFSYIDDLGFEITKEKIYKTNKHLFLQKL